LVERELRYSPELRVVLDDLALELGTVPFVLQRMSNTRIDWLRRAIEQELVRYSPIYEFQHLRRQLSDPAWQLRFAELQGLRETGGVYGPRELALLSASLRDGSGHVRAATARLLGQAKTRLPEALLRQLIQVAVHDGDLETRSAAARALGNLREQAAAAPLLQQLLQLLGDEDQFVRSAAAMALGQLGDAAVLPGLNDALVTLLSDDDAYVREAAARALGRIGAPAAAPRVLAQLARAVDDPDANVHDAASEALGHLRRLRATAPLHGAAYIDSAVA
jgi:HEAT repeat protein